MKFIVYWVTYLSSIANPPVNVAGMLFIDIDNKIVKTYVYGAGYVNWKIDHIHYSILEDAPNRRKDQISHARIIAHNKDIRAVIIIDLSHIELDIDDPDMHFHEHIRYNRKL